jgi:hypothetical protein
MDKKIISTAIASAVALIVANPAEAGKNDREGLDNPLENVSCSIYEEGFEAHWTDPNEDSTPGTKYGGDLEVDAWLAYDCEAGADGFSAMSEVTLEFDLSNDAEDVFAYDCDVADADGVVECWSFLSWDDADAAGEAALSEFIGSAAEACDAVDGSFSSDGDLHAFDGGSEFSVKEMKPGKGGGKQNWVKAFDECDVET